MIFYMFFLNKVKSCVILLCCLFLDSLVIFLTFAEFRKRLRRLTYYLEIYIWLIFEILLLKRICNRYIFRKRAPDFLLFIFLINLQLNFMVLYQIYSKFYIWAKSCQNCDRPWSRAINPGWSTPDRRP